MIPVCLCGLMSGYFFYLTEARLSRDHEGFPFLLRKFILFIEAFRVALKPLIMVNRYCQLAIAKEKFG